MTNNEKPRILMTNYYDRHIIHEALRPLHETAQVIDRNCNRNLTLDEITQSHTGRSRHHRRRRTLPPEKSSIKPTAYCSSHATVQATTRSISKPPPTMASSSPRAPVVVDGHRQPHHRPHDRSGTPNSPWPTVPSREDRIGPTARPFSAQT